MKNRHADPDGCFRFRLRILVKFLQEYDCLTK